MFKTKSEVDRHVDNSLKKINNETERNLRCFSFAKLYFQVGDYEHACRYISLYLSVKPKSAEGHQLLGKALEKLGKKENALEAYRKSLQLDSKQNNLVIKVCELLASDDVDMDKAGARYYCDLAQSFDPHNSAVFNLKERLITAENANPSDVSKLLLDELENRPTDVGLRVRLLKHFLHNNMTKEAYKHASDVEGKDVGIFQNSLGWYEAFAEVLVRYQRDLSYSSSITWEFWFLSVSVLDRLAALSLDDHVENMKSPSEYLTILFNFDQTLCKASQNISACPDRQLSQLFLNHFHAQLYFHLATCLFKQAKKDFMQFKEVSNVTLPLLLASYHSQPPDINGVWLNNSPESKRKMVRKWHQQAAYRCSQSGHVLLAAMKDRKSIILEKASQYSTGMWREQLFKRLFVMRDQHQKMNTSYFVSSPDLLEPTIKMPEHADLLHYDEIAQLNHPDSLHHHIWISLNNDLPKVALKCFEGLSYSVKNLNNCAAESLSVLDVQAFVYCAALCAKSKRDANQKMMYYSNDMPSVLPANITENLGTLNQSKFLTAAYKMYKNEHAFNTGEIRLLLIKGIEVVRCVGHHGLDVKMLVKLANIFEERSKNLTKHSEVEFNDARAELYWKTALPLLEKIKNNQAVIYPSNRLFEYKSKDLTMSEVANYIDKGKLFTAVQLMKKKEYDKALHVFEPLKDPYASYHQSHIYKLLADQKTNQNKENLTSEMRSQNIILLSKARDCLYLTLDRLREPSVDRSHPLNTQLGTDIEKIERLLSRIDPDCTNRNECDGMSDENVSSDSAGEHYLTSLSIHHNSYHNTPKHDAHNNHSTPYKMELNRREARPSPERLDAQLRQMAATKDTAVTSILEQNKLMVDSHRSLLEELRSFKDAVNNLTSTVEELKSIKSGMEELKEIKTTVTDLKHSVNDLQSVVDIVKEMRKDINDLKKDNTGGKNPQLSEEDLYVLDPDYGVDYGLNANLGQYNPNLYQNYQGRLSGANALNPGNLPTSYGALYPGLYPPMAPYMAAAYGGALMPQAPFVPDQQLQGFMAQQSSSLGIGMLTGQGLSQQIPQQPTNLVKEPPKAILSTFTSTTQAAFPSMSPLSKTPSAPSNSNANSTKTAPANVVITSSDPLPTNTTPVAQPVLSVTIPPQHIKGNKPQQPHNYQISLPSSVSGIAATPSILSKPPPIVDTQSMLSDVAPPMFSAVSPAKTPSKNVSLGLSIEKSLDKTFSPNKSNASVDEHDPCPDFKPIIPLPDEVPVTTGEENETVLFCERAKLFRHVNKEWKERGVGNVKILQHKESGKIRVLMRRDQVHKICANHFLTADMSMSPMANNDRAYIWAAQDFTDGEMTVEKFCIRFKTSEEAKKFHSAFEDAKGRLSDKPKPAPKNLFATTSNKPAVSETLGGFVFSSTPSFKPKEVAPITTVAVSTPTVEPVKPSPFSNFSFANAKTTTSGNLFGNLKTDPIFSPTTTTTTTTPQKKDSESEDRVEDFVPTAEFAPVVALPEIVDVKTGEENAEVLFESRSKLYKLVTADGAKEWKERGVGVIKILKEDTVRLVMRRDQVHKVCLNHQVLKNMIFKVNEQNPKAVFWSAKDFSEGELTSETFTARFKSEELAGQFLKTLHTAQASLNESNVISNKHHKPAVESKSPGLLDKHKPPKGNWECKNCYISNEAKYNHCVACETPKNNSVKETKDSGESGSNFSFGAAKTPGAGSWGAQFKPAEGSWECQMCFVRNDASKAKCLSCETPKDGSAPATTASTIKGINLDTPGQKFSFGVQPAAQTPAAGLIFGQNLPAVKPETKGFGDAFKPKVDSWECQQCFVRNEGSVLHCASCESPKDDTVPKKEASKGISLDTGGMKFSFGVSPAAASISTPPQQQPSFSFGKPNIFGAATGSPFSFSPAVTEATKQTPIGKFTFAPAADKAEEKNDGKFVFGSPTKHEFEFTPRSPNRRISSGQGDEDSDGSYAEEEADNIYFKPVIALPDKIDAKTGEEEEDSLYVQRAKLYRFVTGEWKERGIGDLKILKRTDNGKLRVLMRREQIMKICLNHVLTKDVEYRPKDDKTWLFHAADYSEGEISRDQFCLRFKSAELAAEFKAAVDEALGGACADVSIEKVPTPNESDDDVIILDEPINPEEISEAKRLQLPYTFFQYRKKNEYCTCAQCLKDDEYFKGTEFASHTPATTKFTGITPQVSSTSTTPSIFSFSTASSAPASVFGGSTASSTPGGFFSFATKSPAVNTAETESNSSLKSLLSTPSTLGKNSGNIFQTPSAPSIFGSKSIFGGSTASATPVFGASGGSIFSTNVTPSNTSIFGGGSTPSSDVFGSPSLSSVTSATSIFGQSKALFGNAASATSSNASIFQSSAVAKPATNIFGGAVTVSGETTKLKESDEVVLKCKSEVSFATLAANTAPEAKPAFAAKEDGGTAQPFSFLGAGAPVFGATTIKKVGNKNKSLNAEEVEEAEEAAEQSQTNEEEYDPHYEPIIPMPEAIEVSTGEEAEEIKFNERAKLYRYNADTKEWKERGVGQIKILYHPENATYRLILRREQVHKVVLNQLVRVDLDLQPMSTSDKAWMWAGYNYVEDEARLEKLAVRFKTSELAQTFKEAMDLTVCKVIEINNRKLSQIPTTVAELAAGGRGQEGSHRGVVEDYGDEEEDEDDDEDDEDDEDQIRSVMYESESTDLQLWTQSEAGQWLKVGEGMAGVYYYNDLFAAKVNFVDIDSGECLSTTLVGSNTYMEQNGNECVWKAVERADETDLQWKNLKVAFPDARQAHDFHKSYLEGVTYAQEVGICDDLDLDYEGNDYEGNDYE
ncbi:unnamed protein product [Brassicogethes aeneus]|uniref:E3 SUMO-protein ligase RanBP2 n=1 Tax=Brassicogethes aeneus TaxID=1431903 RepID=A0A9P0APW4_BRAAE|nr:unnamed protein product [Brassicogethes aeneus]